MSLRWGIAAAPLLVVAVFYGLFVWCDIDALKAAEEAQKEFSGDRVEALCALVVSETHSLEERNRAIWALGRIRDPRALPTLEGLYTGRECDHAHEVCQYELAKALANCRGETFDPLFRSFKP